MTEDFIPYEEALALKELGFNEECFAVYSEKGVLSPITNLKPCNSNVPSYATAPLYQQAFRWFREEHGLVSCLRWNDSYRPLSWEWVIEGESFGGETECKKDWSYEEAELACLVKLIEIVKEKNNG